MAKKPVNALLAAVATGALLLTACGSDPEPDAGAQPADTTAPAATPSTGAPSTGAAAGDPVAAAQELVDSVSTPVEEFTAPGPALGDLSSLEGQTVYYIPANYSIPMFSNIADALTEALGHAGVDVQVCDAEANPSSAATCLSQAVDVGAAAVISGSVPEEFATTAFQSVRDAGIPLLYTQLAPAGPGEPDSVGYLTPDNVEMHAWNSSWVIADSGGEAEILVVKVTDTPATTLWIDQGVLAVYEEQCAGCAVTVVETNTAQLERLPSLVSSAMVSNPGIGYVHVAFDVTVQPTVQGLQAAGVTDIKISSQDGTLPVMQMLGEGRFMASAVGFNQEALGWYAADQVLRMMSGGTAVQDLDFPYRRLFTSADAAGLDLSPEGEASGEWYGGTEYAQGFLELWGLAG